MRDFFDEIKPVKLKSSHLFICAGDGKRYTALFFNIHMRRTGCKHQHVYVPIEDFFLL